MKNNAFKFLSFVFFIKCAFCEIYLDAEKISYDPKSNIITAEGKVIIIQEISNTEKRTLYSEKIEYNKKTKDLKLLGDSIIHEPSGEIISAKNIELDKNFKHSIVKALVIILKDNSKIKAKEGKSKDKIYEFENVIYTPCDEKPCKLPLWDLIAEKVIYDPINKKFIYKNVKLRLKGIPVFYSPYFKHPSFEVKRQTGFLAPIIKTNNDTGFYLGMPYYIVIDKYKDFKITPFINFKNRGFVSGEYRQSFQKCDFIINSSILTKSKALKAATEEKRTRWHIDSKITSYNLDNKMITFRVNRASDTTYKLKYPVNNDNKTPGFLKRKCNESKLVIDSFDKNYFMTLDSYIFQISEKDIAPKVIPHLNFQYIKDDFLTGRAEIHSDTIAISRNSEKTSYFSKDFFRSSNSFNWSKESQINHFLINFKTSAKADIYKTETDKTNSNKIFPFLENQISAFLPLSSKVLRNQHNLIWGPKITLSSVESFNKTKELNQNEDSVFYSFNDLNLHSLNRFGLYDKIENGERISVGLDGSIYGFGRRYLNFFIGKSQNIGNRNRNNNNKINERNSTISRIVLKPFENLSFRARIVGLPKIEKTKIFESGVNINLKKISLGIGYIYDSRIIDQIKNKPISQLGLSLDIKISEFWKISGTKILNFKKSIGKRNLSQGIFADYSDECFSIGFGLYNSKFKDKDIKPHTGFVLSISFKNLGKFSKSINEYIYKSDIGIVE